MNIIKILGTVFLMLTIVNLSYGSIAFDALSGPASITSTTLTFAHTTTGSDRILFVQGHDRVGATSQVTGVTYDGVPMIKGAQVQNTGDRWITMWWVIAPATGTNDIVVTASVSQPLAFSGISYTGVDQNNPIDGNDSSIVVSTDIISTDITTTTDNDWALMFGKDNAGSRTYTSSTGDTFRFNTQGSGQVLLDTGAAITPAGLNTMTIDAGASAGAIAAISMAFREVQPNSPTIVTNITAFYDSTSLNVSLNTSALTDMSFILNGGGLTSIGNNTNFETVILTGVEGVNNFSFLSDNGVGAIVWTNGTFIIDLTNPSLINNIPSELNSPDRTLNLNTSIIRQDNVSGIAGCFISVNNSQTANCTATSFQFNLAGNFTYNITVTDNVGNVNQSLNNLIYVNPNLTLRFNNTFTSTFISGYQLQFDTFNLDVTGTNATITLFDLPLGFNNFTFVKFGFNQSVFDITTNLSIEIDDIFQVNAVTLIMTMFNASNPSEQLTFNTTIFNSTFSVFFTNQTNFEQDFDSLPSGFITILVDSPDFAQARFFQTLTPFTAINITGFLIPEGISSPVTFTTREFGTDQLLSEVIIEAQQLVNGTFTTVSQAITDESGQTFMNLDVSEEYKFIFTKDSFVTGTSFAIPQVTSYLISLKQVTTAFSFINGVSYQLLPINSVIITNNNITFSAFVSSSGLTFTNFSVITNNGTILFNATSTNPTGTTFTFTVEILNITNVTTLTSVLFYNKDGLVDSVSQTYTLQNLINGSFIAIANEYNDDDSEDAKLFRWFIMVIGIAASLMAGRVIGVNTTGAALLIIPVVYFFNFIGWMPLNYAFAISLAAGTLFIGGRLFR